MMNPNSHPRFTNILFTSVSPFINSSSLFPTHDRRIGISVSCGYHPEEGQVMVLVEEEQPSFLSTSVGEYISPDKAESVVRETCSKLASACRLQAQELLQHAERLEKLANQNLPILDASKIDKDSDHKVIYMPREEKKEIYKSIYAPRPKSAALDMDDI